MLEKGGVMTVESQRLPLKPQGIPEAQAQAFRLVFQLHTPLVLPLVVPRLDVLLHEAACRRALNWSCYPTIPLVFDEARGGYRASQLIFGVTTQQGLTAEPLAVITRLSTLPLLRAANVRAPLRIDGGDWAPKLTHHQGLLSPYVLFYAQGDPEACVDLLQEVPNIGKGHSRGQGMVSVMATQLDANERWRQRVWRSESEHADMAYTAVPDNLRLTCWGDDEPAYRPPRILREVLA